MKIAMETLDIARPAIGALAVGLAQRCLDECVKHLRRCYAAKSFPGETLQFELADMQIEIEGARQAQHITPWRCERRSCPSPRSRGCKNLGTAVAMNVTSRAMRLMGSHAYTSEFGKFMRDAKVMQIYEGTN